MRERMLRGAVLAAFGLAAGIAIGQDNAALAERVKDLEEEVDGLNAKVGAAQPGTSGYLISGYLKAGFMKIEDDPSSFGAAVNPIFLWSVGDRLLVEAELELEVSEDGTEAMLEYANAAYLLNDYAILRAGKFLLAFANFGERLHPAWINKLPDRPLPFDEGGLAPESGVGAEIRGAFPIDGVKLNYALYVINGPSLNGGPAVEKETPAMEEEISAMEEESPAAGTLDFDNFPDNNNNKGVGGRLGFLPLPELEIGYSFLTAKVGSPETPFSDVKALLQAVDLSYVRNSDILMGTVDLRAEWVWSNVEDAGYGTDEAPILFNNERDGGYVQLAYRPDRIKQPVVKNMEGVVRYDTVNQPSGAPDAVTEQRWTAGLNYWITSAAVVKLAYRFDDKDEGEDANGPLVEIGVGF